MFEKYFLKIGIPAKRFLYRHLLAVVKYSTPAKFINLMLCETERRFGTIKPNSKPYIAVIDITNICRLRCYHCPTGKRLYGRKPGFMDLVKLEKFLKEAGKYLYLAHLYSWGEPLLHPEVAKIIRIVRSHRASTLISTNLNIRNRKLLTDICDAGLDYLTLSIDGGTQEVYSQYRVGGNLNLVLENIRYITDYKRKNNLRTPVIEWQYLIFDHNQHEVEFSRRLAMSLGVDIFNAKPGIIPKKFSEGWGDCKRCPFLWNSIVLQTDGGISACCNFIDKEDDFGNVSQSFKEIWHGSRYKIARSMFSPKLSPKLPDDLNHPCLNCSLVRSQPHLTDYLKKSIYARIDDSRSAHKDDTIAVRSGIGKGDYNKKVEKK